MQYRGRETEGRVRQKVAAGRREKVANARHNSDSSRRVSAADRTQQRASTSSSSQPQGAFVVGYRCTLGRLFDEVVTASVTSTKLSYTRNFYSPETDS